LARCGAELREIDGEETRLEQEAARAGGLELGAAERTVVRRDQKRRQSGMCLGERAAELEPAVGAEADVDHGGFGSKLLHARPGGLRVVSFADDLIPPVREEFADRASEHRMIVDDHHANCGRASRVGGRLAAVHAEGWWLSTPASSIPRLRDLSSARFL
jgi:hypothetical protein